MNMEWNEIFSTDWLFLYENKAQSWILPLRIQYLERWIARTSVLTLGILYVKPNKNGTWSLHSSLIFELFEIISYFQTSLLNKINTRTLKHILINIDTIVTLAKSRICYIKVKKEVKNECQPKLFQKSNQLLPKYKPFTSPHKLHHSNCSMITCFPFVAKLSETNFYQSLLEVLKLLKCILLEL